MLNTSLTVGPSVRVLINVTSGAILSDVVTESEDIFLLRAQQVIKQKIIPKLILIFK